MRAPMLGALLLGVAVGSEHPQFYNLALAEQEHLDACGSGFERVEDLEPKVKVMGGAAEAERSLARTRRATKRIRCVAAQRELAPLLAEAGRAEEALELLEDSHRFELGGPSPTVETLMLHGKLRLRQGPLFDADAGSNSVLLAYELANPVRGTVGGGTLAPICGDDGGQDGCFHVRQPGQLRWVLR